MYVDIFILISYIYLPIKNTEKQKNYFNLTLDSNVYFFLNK